MNDCNLSSTPIVGTELKLNINIEPLDGNHMANYDFTVDLYCSSKNVLSFKKGDSELINIDQDNYIVLVDTSKVGTGALKCRVTAYLPDTQFPNGTRTEIIILNTGINILRNL